MKKQKKFQIFLLALGCILVFGTYFLYPKINKTKLSNESSVNKENLKLEKEIKEEQDTVFTNVEYKGFNLEKPFTLKSKKAYILSVDNPNVVHMNDMFLTLRLENNRQIIITSENGKFNKVTQDCFFENAVKVVDSVGKTTIYADNLDLLASSSTAQIFNNVNLINDNGSSLKADKIEYDFEGKKLKVSMFDDKSINMKVIKN
jgi:hypothetical protein